MVFNRHFPSFLSRAANQRASSYLDHIQRPGYWKQLPSSMHSIILTSRKISLKTVIKTSSRLRHILLDLPIHKVSASKGLYGGNQLIQLCCNRWLYFSFPEKIASYNLTYKKEIRLYFCQVKNLFHLLGWCWFIQLYRLQMYNSTIHHLYIALWAHHQYN